MKLNKLYLESIQHLPGHERNALIKEAPHTRIPTTPPGYEFLKGDFVDLGFENLKLPRHDHRTLLKAFVEHGVVIPNTQHRLRLTPTNATVIEPAEGQERVTLPIFWRQAVLVFRGDKPTWIGKLVRPDQIPPDTDLTQYHDTSDGWSLVGQE